MGLTSAITVSKKRLNTRAAGRGDGCTERGAEESQDLKIQGGDPQPQGDLRNLAKNKQFLVPEVTVAFSHSFKHPGSLQ